MTGAHAREERVGEEELGVGEGVVLSPEAGSCKEWPAGWNGSILLRRTPTPIAIAPPMHAYAVAHGAALDGASAGRSPHSRAMLPLSPRLARAAPRRVATFLAGRHCALAALRAAGAMVPGDDLPMDDIGAPCWPVGFVGSITHTHRLAAAVVAPGEAYAGLGIDCEHLLGDDQATELATTVVPELPMSSAGDDARVPLDRATLVTVAFSAKESFYKCLAPLTGVFFEFHDAILVEIDVAAGRLRLRLARDLAPGFARGFEFEARFTITAGAVATLVALPSMPPRATRRRT